MIISISNQKGGIAKTTTTQAMGLGLQKLGYKVLLIDLDGQSSLCKVMGAETNIPTIYDVMRNKVDINEVVQSKLSTDMISSNKLLSAADMEFTQPGREYILKKALSKLNQKYDFIIIDTPPALGILTINALTAADQVIIPLEADILSIDGMAQLVSTITLVIEHCNSSLVIDGILLIKHKPRTILAQGLTCDIEEVAKRLNTKVYHTFIRESISIREAQAKKEDIFIYSPESNAQNDYKQFLDEYLLGVCHNG